MKRILILLLFTTAVLAVAPTPPTLAVAPRDGAAFTTATLAQTGDQRRCVSRREYQDIRWQWPPATKARVTDHFDLYGYFVEGWGSYYHRDAIWAYHKCREWGRGNVYVWFDNYTWGDRRPTHRVYAMAPSLAAYRHNDWTHIQ